MIQHTAIHSEKLRSKIKAKVITLAGNRRLKIFGLLNCESGKRMKKENRVFFENQSDAIRAGFRPCGHCLVEAYTEWRRLFRP